MTPRETEMAMRRIAKKANRRATFDLLPAGSPVCLCGLPPVMAWSQSSKEWHCYCRDCTPDDRVIIASSHAEAIAIWTKRNERVK